MDSVQVAGSSCPSVDGMAGTDGPFRIQVKVVKCLALRVPVDARGARDCKVTEPMTLGTKTRVGMPEGVGLGKRPSGGDWAWRTPAGGILGTAVGRPGGRY